MKRFIDVSITSIALVVLSPLMLAIAVLIRLTSRGPAIHCQQRVGRHGKTFVLYKFRTMRVDSDSLAQREFNRKELAGELEDLGNFSLPDDDRVTVIGRPLRKYSLDELPQIVNVLKGDMSLVGPRPSFDWEFELFDEKYRRRTDVLPGITGLWQVEGRRTIDMNGMLELDLEYVDRGNLRLDIEILLRTIPAVIRSTGAA